MTAILLALVLAVAPPRFEAKTLDGQALEGALTALDAQRLTIQTSHGPAAVPIAKLVDLSIKARPSPAAAAEGICVECVDGSVLFARQYTARGDRASVTLPNGQALEMPVRAVLAVRLQRQSDAVAAAWRNLVQAKRETDLLVVCKNDALDYHQGVAHDVTAETVQFDLEGEQVSAPRAKIFGLAYHHRAEEGMPSAECRVTDVWGSKWSARGLQLTDKFQWTTPGGMRVSLPAEQVAQVDFSAGKVAYLSDLEAESIRWAPLFAAQKGLPVLQEFYAPRHDRNFDSAPLQLDGTEYRKGLAIHSRTELTYDVPDGFRRFSAVAGIDDSMRPRGKVRLVVRGDARPLLETTIAGNEQAKPIDLDLSGVRRLVILVDFTDVVGSGDRLLLCNARITK